MFLFAVVAALVLSVPFSVADATDAPAAPPSPASQVHSVGDTLSYSLNATMSQGIAGLDAFGRHINQTSAPTTLKLHENISITKSSVHDLGMHRVGSITAVVTGARPVNKDGQGWTTVNQSGVITHDSGKLGGLFLLPVPFLADAAMKGGDELAVGDTWSSQLGTKLYGMTARPHLKYTVVAERLVAGAKIYSIDASGTVPIKEPVMTTNGEPLGYATGIADLSAHIEYDRANRRLISMHAQLTDTLRYSGPTKHTSGHVKDRQRLDVALESAPDPSGAQSPSDDPSSGPLP